MTVESVHVSPVLSARTAKPPAEPSDGVPAANAGEAKRSAAIGNVTASRAVSLSRVEALAIGFLHAESFVILA
jgi:hypothetical protein